VGWEREWEHWTVVERLLCKLLLLTASPQHAALPTLSRWYQNSCQFGLRWYMMTALPVANRYLRRAE
jgi:hypothetical protein